MNPCWIWNEKTNQYLCSLCNCITDHDFDSCPNCGYRHHMTSPFSKYYDELLKQKEELEYTLTAMKHEINKLKIIFDKEEE